MERGGKMLFIERLKLSAQYKAWLAEENEKNNFAIPANPETFLVFLESKGYEIIKKGEDEE